MNTNAIDTTNPGAPMRHRDDMRTQARALAYIYAAGAALVGVTILVPHSRSIAETSLILLAGAAACVALMLFVASRRLHPWAYQAIVALGTLLISAAIVVSRDGSSAFAVFYIWVALYSYYFFTRAQAVAQAALVGLAYGFVLVFGPHGDALGARWLLTMGTMVVSGELISRLVGEVRERAREITWRAEDGARIAAAARDLSSMTDAHAARPAICRAAQELAGAALGILYEPDPKGQELVSTAVVGAAVEPIHLPFAGSPSGATTAFASGQPFFVADLADHPAVTQPVADRLGVVSALWQPVLRNGVPIGVLTLAWETRVAEVPERVWSLVSLLAAEAAIAIERADLLARLEAVARTDDLTGLANRRAWDEHLPRELARARRDDKQLCVAMIDLDRFKEYNDASGHQAGDRLLRETAATWREMLRPSDLLARYGGEEFVLLLPGCDADAGLEAIERLRARTPEDQTCSAGVAVWDGHESPDRLISRADAALYDAKKAGRDRAVAAL